jgi:hypothetical protein
VNRCGALVRAIHESPLLIKLCAPSPARGGRAFYETIVIPAQAGIQGICKALKRLDSRFHRNDGKKAFLTFYETINNCKLQTKAKAEMGKVENSFSPTLRKGRGGILGVGPEYE